MTPNKNHLSIQRTGPKKLGPKKLKNNSGNS